jgi:hypothetical protein
MTVRRTKYRRDYRDERDRRDRDERDRRGGTRKRGGKRYRRRTHRM